MRYSLPHRIPRLLTSIGPVFLLALLAEAQVITPRMHHLRNLEPREWTSYPQHAEANALELTFDLAEPEKVRLLTWRQSGVKQTWTVHLNGKRLSNLERDHNDLEHAEPIPSGLLRAAGNQLRIETKASKPDDIRVGEMTFFTQTREELTSGAQLQIRVSDEDSGQPLPCRLTLVARDRQTLPLLGASSDDRLAVRAGVVYTLDGEAQVGLRPGHYEIYAGRGFEYSLDRREVHLEPGDNKQFHLKLRREVATPGLVACDTHLHTFQFARHGDCSLTERLITLAGEGVELPISTEHNQHIDYAPEARRIGADRYFTPVIGCEVTTSEAHFNSFPIVSGSPPADTRLRPWPQVFQGIFQTPGVRVVILNHARDVHRGFRPFDPAHFDDAAGIFTDGRILEANGLELINSGAQQSDPMQLVRDWFALLRSGHRIAGVGSSDSHTVNFAIAGQGRTYLPCPDTDPSQIDVPVAVEAFLRGDTNVSFGLLTLLDLENEDSIVARVHGPGWTRATRLTLYLDGTPLKEITIPEPASRQPGLKWEQTWKLDELPLQNGSFLVAIAEGPGITEPWWPMMPPYQATSPEFNPYVMGISRALWPLDR